MRPENTKKSFLSCLGHTVAVYDFETTGLSADNDMWIQLGIELCRVSAGNVWEPIGEPYNFIINPGRPIPEVITEITGFTDEDVADKPKEEDVIAEIMDIFSQAEYVCGHNIIPFDNKFATNMYARYGKAWPFDEEHSLDTLAAVKQLINIKEIDEWKADEEKKSGEKIKGTYNLTNMSRMLDIVPDDASFHKADFDVSMSKLLAQWIIPKYQSEKVEEMKFYREDLKPSVKSIIPWKAFPSAYKTGNYFFVNTNMGKYRYDRYSYSWTVVEKWKPCSIEAVQKAAFEFAGVDSDIDFSKGDWLKAKKDA